MDRNEAMDVIVKSLLEEGLSIPIGREWKEWHSLLQLRRKPKLFFAELRLRMKWQKEVEEVA